MRNITYETLIDQFMIQDNIIFSSEHYWFHLYVPKHLNTRFPSRDEKQCVIFLRGTILVERRTASQVQVLGKLPFYWLFIRVGLSY